MSIKTVQDRKDEILVNLIKEYEEGVKEEESITEIMGKWDKLIKDCIDASDDVKQDLHEVQMKNSRNKGYLRTILPKYPHKYYCTVCVKVFDSLPNKRKHMDLKHMKSEK